MNDRFLVMRLAALSIACASVGICFSACSAGTTTSSGVDGSTTSDASSADGSRADVTPGTDGAASGTCSSDMQCTNPQKCLAGATPGGTTPVGCGAQPQSTCNVDSDCADAGTTDAGAALVCIAASGCRGSYCGPGCTGDGECGIAEACKLQHCVVKPCTGDGDCPDNYSCQSSVCAIKPCAQDSDCKGYCVNSACAGAPGGCTTEEPVP